VSRGEGGGEGGGECGEGGGECGEGGGSAKGGYLETSSAELMAKSLKEVSDITFQFDKSWLKAFAS